MCIERRLLGDQMEPEAEAATCRRYMHSYMHACSYTHTCIHMCIERHLLGDQMEPEAEAATSCRVTVKEAALNLKHMGDTCVYAYVCVYVMFVVV